MSNCHLLAPAECLETPNNVLNSIISSSDIDTSYFVLTVDLWSDNATKEVNLVRHSATSPSISATTATSYPPNPEEIGPTSVYASTPLHQVQIAPPYSQPQPPPVAHPHVPMPYHQHQYPQQGVQPQNQPLPPPPIPSQAQQGGYWINQTPTPMTPTGQMPQVQGPLLSPSAQSTLSCDPRSHPSGMFTRNLIGSLCVSAFKLTDPDNNMGVWFILQDLSVRTEGLFRCVLLSLRPNINQLNCRL